MARKISVITQLFCLLSVQSLSAAERPVPASVLAFPKEADYYHSEQNPGIDIRSRANLVSWANGQGFTLSEDSPAGGYSYNRAVVFRSDGLRFRLTAPVDEKGSSSRAGWVLVLDMGLPVALQSKQNLTSDFRFYRNILRYDIYIDGIHHRRIEAGWGRTAQTPVTIPVPYIRNSEGYVNVEIRMNNHPDNFGILYDAFLRR